jgi:ATP-binding cassette, subfamily F, member 3
MPQCRNAAIPPPSSPSQVNSLPVLLNVSNVTKSFGADHILLGVTFRVDAREKVALVGRNGTGKTTLLKILTGQYGADTGGVNLAQGARVGYLRQEVLVDEGLTVLEEAQSSRAHQLELKRRLEELEAKLEKDSTEADLEEYALLHEHFLESEGYSIESDIKTILLQMGFTEDEFSKRTAKLSGGEKTRLAIAKLLLEEPDLMILDEPTNHLDLQATEWLESWIRGYHGAVLLVSHDRAFLENTAQRVIEMRDGQVKSYPGNFTKFLQLRAEEDARQAEVAKRQDQEIAKMDEYVRRFMNSQRTAQARGRLKLMNRLIESKVEAPKNEKGMKGAFAAGKRSGDLVLETEKLTVGFPGSSMGSLPLDSEDFNPEHDLAGHATHGQAAHATTLFKDLNWTVRNGERWGVIGENGSGKSTLIKVALGFLEPLEGKARLGANVVAGYFSQDVSDIDVNQSPLDFMVYECDMLPADARNLLGRYLISGDDVYRPIKTFSGGEKNKLALARLTNLNPNLLILDEPTNHLDMASREALTEILREYKGTLILISHDRWLLSNSTDHILDIRKAGPIQYPGSYTEYKSGRQPKPKAAPTTNNQQPKTNSAPTLSPREVSKEIGRLEKLVEQLENQVADEEANLKDIEEQLANVDPTADILALTQAHASTQERLAGAMSAWEETTLKLEEFMAMQG